MNRIRDFLLAVTFTTSLAAFTPMSHAAHDGNDYNNSLSHFGNNYNKEMSYDYSNTMGDKAARAAANIFTAPLEIPKNMINTVNDSNIAYGMVGGLAKGILNTVARIGAGVAELVTVPLQTRPIAYPIYIWDDYDVDSTYGPYYRLENDDGTQYSEAPSYPQDSAAPASTSDQSAADAAAAAANEANSRAIAAEQAAERAARSAAETSQKLDSMFEKSMMK